MRVAVVLVALAAVSVAAADGTTTTKTKLKHYPFVGPDDAWSAACGFEVDVNGYDDATITDYYDSSGNLVQEVTKDKFVGTMTSQYGVTINRAEDATITYVASTGYATWKGLEESESYVKGRVIAEDKGTIVFDQDGNVVSENGSFPITNGPGTTAVCNALMGA